MKKIAKLFFLSSQLTPNYPKAESTVDGLTVRSDIPNQSSISASFNDYEIFPGIREIPMSEFGGPKSVFYATNDFQKSKELSKQIEKSGEINPLIIAIDKEGPYILEGAHRYVALHYLNKQSLPALVVIDQDEQVKTASIKLNEIDKIVQAAKKDETPSGYVFRIMDQKEWDNISQDKTFSGSFWSSDITEYIKNFDENSVLAVIKDEGSPRYRGLIPKEDMYTPHEELIQKYHHYMINNADKKDILAAYKLINGKRTKIASDESLTLDQARFTKDSLDKVKDYIGTTNIDTISKKDDPQEYKKYTKLYEDHPTKEERYRSPERVTGIKAHKNIGGKTILIWRDAAVDDWMLVAPKGFLKTLEVSPMNDGRLNVVASLIAGIDLEERANERQSRFDQFYKKHDLSPDQEPKDIAIMVPGLNNKYSIVSPSTKFKGKWQLTYFDEQGPWGDQTHNNLDEAIRQTSTQNLNKAEVMKGQQSRLQVASLALFHMGLKTANAEIDKKERMKQRKKRMRIIVDKELKQFDDFYKKHNLSPDQEPKDIAIMIPGGWTGGDLNKNKYSIISPSVKFKGDWQVTYFDEKGPWGDQTHNNLDEAIRQTSTQNLNKAEVMKGQKARLQVASLALFHMGLKLASEWNTLPDSDDLKDLIDALYELEFKYSQLKNQADKWKGNPQRYDNTLNGISKKLLSVTKDIAKQLLPVYKDWLASHAITNPDKWAEARYKDNAEIDDSTLFGALEGEYGRYGKGNIEDEIRTQTSKHLNSLPHLREFLDEFAKEEINNLESEKDEYEEEEYQDRIKTLEDPDNMLDYMFDVWGVSEFINNFVNNDPNLAEELYILWYEEIVFPVWYAKWGAEGIDETRERVEDRYKEIKSLASGSISDPQKAAGMTNAALQESHQTGQMMDYIEQQYDVSASHLENLSNMDTSEWKKELKEMGLKVAAGKLR